MDWNPPLGTPEEAGGAAYNCAEESASDCAPELIQSSFFPVLTCCSERDASKGATEKSEYKTASDMSVPSAAGIHPDDLLPTDRSSNGASAETIAQAVGPDRSDRDQNEFGVRRRFEYSRASPCFECQSVDFLRLPVERAGHDREEKNCREY
jgi:hypothetical protein